MNIGFTYSNRYTAYGTEQIVGVGVGYFKSHFQARPYRLALVVLSEVFEMHL